MSNCIIAVIGMPGCPACEEHMPRVQVAAARHPGVQVYIINAESQAPEAQAFLNKYGIQATPTTLVLRRPVGVIKREGALEDAELEGLFQIAERS